MGDLTVRGEQRCFGGTQGFYSHRSDLCGCEMGFAVFQPPQALAGAKVPLLTYLSGLTCTEENFTTKAGFQRLAADLGLMVLAPDTSPRGLNLPGEDEAYDFGSGAGFYVDATEAPLVKRLPNVQLHHPGTAEGHRRETSRPTCPAKASPAIPWADTAPSPFT